MTQATVYSTEVCPYCIKAKALLEKEGIKYNEVLIGKDIEKERFKEDLSEKTGKLIETVPQVFINNHYIGGYDDLKAHFDNTEPKLSEDSFSDFSL